MNKLLLGDCLEIMPSLETQSVDMVLADLPYGSTSIEWDKIIPLNLLWKEYNRIIKRNGVIALFSTQPFTTDLINSNRKNFKYEIIWKKSTVSGFLNANKAPLRAHENICIFYKYLPVYNPIKSKVVRNDLGKVKKEKEMRSKQYRTMKQSTWTETGERFPTDVIEFGKKGKVVNHPTHKPVELLKYLIMTYTNTGDVVLDNCMGSGSTGVACIETNRKFIGIEKNKEYFELAKNRISQTPQPLFIDND